MHITPQIGDRVFFNYGCEHGTATGKVIARRESRWGVSFEVQMDETAEIQHIDRYVGTAQESYGGWIQARESRGIGVYVLTPNPIF